MSGPGYKCATCHRLFSSKNHLRRHESSHTSQSPRRCEFCDRKYSRNDALRRHYKSCPRIGAQPKPGPARPGRRRKACDSCAEQRINCDGGLSCSACQANGISCTYQRLHTLPQESRELLLAPGMSTRRQSLRSATNPDERSPEKTSLPFLLNYSAPGNHSSGDVNRVLSLFSTAESVDESLDSALPSLGVEADQAHLFFGDSWNMFFGSFKIDGQTQSSPLPLGLEDLDQRQIASSRMVDCIIRSRAMNGKYEAAPSPDNAQEFFAEHKVGDYIEAYFERIVRPRSRIVLKSTFNLETVSTPLLLSMFLMGADCDTSDGVKLRAIEYAEIVEKVVFECADFQRLMYRKQETGGVSLEANEIELIQAAILILLIQLSSPNAATRRRTRIQRYPALQAISP
ncbi:hypothetical protein N7460_008117 [Penicillium canescens]|uniref:Uncharacterized protein n=1 Tax=Penicillium canescens TaxID=5083 RepID=A0AAD6IAZ0_PENCN|nr:hypothetical protein N7460_008117 [Penicillium canescens]